jgi:flavorubredoxin
MMPFRAMAQKAMEKLASLEVKVIAPSHGPIHRRLEPIFNAYKRWTAGETRWKAAIAYVSMWGGTEAMVKQMAETLVDEGIELALHNLAVADVGDLAKDLVDSRAIVLGAPTVLGGAHPLAVYATYLLRALRPPAKFLVLLSCYGWGGGAMKQVQELLGQLKLEVVGALEVNGPPTEDHLRQIAKMGRTLAKRIKEGA